MIGYSVRENDFDEKKKRPGLKLNPGLALIGLRTTGTRGPIYLDNQWVII